MKSSYVVTHTESIHHVQGLVGGWYDTSLTKNGRNQISRIAEALYSEIGEQNIPIYSSDLTRCVQTADAFTEICKSTVILDRNLREMSYGPAEGKTTEWWNQNVVHRSIDGNELDYRMFSNSESRRDIRARIQRSLNQIISKSAIYSIIITHGFALTFVIMAWFKVLVENMDLYHFQPYSGRVTLLKDDVVVGGRTVTFVNNIDYLAG